MSCNCNGCGQPQRLCRCPKGKGEAPKRAYIAECTDCDPCRPCESMVKICSFVTPTLTEGQRFRNSFVYNQEDDSVYYISDDGTPTRFGSSPMFIDNFNPDDKAIPRQAVFDFANNKAYVFNPEGEYITIDLAGGGTSSPTVLTYIDGAPEDWTREAGYDENSLMSYTNLDATFTNESTGEVMTVEQVFEALEDGEKFVFNNVPFGEPNPTAQYPVVSRLSLSSRQEYDNTQLDAHIVGYTGIVSIGYTPTSSDPMVTVPHCWGLSKIVFGETTSYVLLVQAPFTLL